jgi:peptidoglycan/xylan/chitin deacetylase (PgdA/CDA1 family)
MNRPIQTRPPVRFRRKALCAFERALHWSGAASLHTRVSGGGAVILMYHSVADDHAARFIDPRLRLSPQAFDQQMRFIKKHRRIITLDQLIDAIVDKRPLPAGTVVITIDDAYRDTLHQAAPILEHHRLPATLFVPTGCVRDGQTHWIDRLYTLFATRTVDLPATDEQYRAAMAQLITADARQRDERLAQLRDELRPTDDPPRLTMNFDELRDMARRYPGIDIGGHTVDHVDLSGAADDVVDQQVSGCIADIERELDRPVRHFAFPCGRPSARAAQLLRGAGVRSAMIAGEEMLIDHTADPYALPRIDAVAPMSLFRFFTSGAYPRLPRMLVGKA